LIWNDLPKEIIHKSFSVDSSKEDKNLNKRLSSKSDI